MKTTISFDFTDDEKDRANIVLHAEEWYNVVWTIWDFLVREAHKGYKFGEEGREVVEAILDELLEAIEQYGLRIE